MKHGFQLHGIHTLLYGSQVIKVNMKILRKRMTKGHQKKDLEKEMWTASFKFSWSTRQSGVETSGLWQ